MRRKNRESMNSKKTKILFVCWGNICRSPMAEFVMKDLLVKAGRENEFHIESAGTSSEEHGSPIYPPALKKLREHGIGTPGNELGVGKKRARKITSADYKEFDLIIGMDSINDRMLKQRFGNDPDAKICSLLDFTSRPGDVADPWYTRNFEKTWDDVYEGCIGLLAYLDSV